MSHVATDEQIAEFRRVLEENGTTECPKCKTEIGIGTVCWNNGETEYGTPYSYTHIHCECCDHEIAHGSKWGDCDDLNEAIEILDDSWRDGPEI
jgi:hypothetical protein